MSEYRIRSTGEVKSQGQIRKMHPNVSMPRVWNEDIHEQLGIDPVLSTPRPEPSGAYKAVTRNGVEQNADGNWVQAWIEQDITGDDRIAHDEKNALEARTKRDGLLTETDHFGLSDVTMSAEMTAYRQALRDVPQQAGFPSTITWPTKPE